MAVGRVGGISDVPPTVDLNALRARHPDLKITVSDGASSPSTHMEFGEHWQCITEVARGAERSSLLKLTLPPALHSSCESLGFHPALLDMAIAGSLDLIPGADLAADFFVPLSFERVRLFRPMPPVFWSHVRLLSPTAAPANGRPEFATFSATLFDQSGQVIADFSTFTMIRVRDKSALVAPADAAVDPDEPIAAVGAQARMANNVLEVGLNAAIRPHEGVSALQRVLNAKRETSASPEQWVISSQDLHGLLRQLRRGNRPGRQRLPETDLKPLCDILLRHDAVAAADARFQLDAQKEPRLVAYVVYDDDADATVSELRRHVKRSVRSELVPRVFVELDEMPAGVDYPNPFGRAKRVVPPRTATEKALAAIWADLLGVDEVGIHDNFFDVGGHSLLSIRLLSRIDKKVGVRLQHEQIVVSSLEQLAARCDELVGKIAAAAPTHLTAESEGKERNAGEQRGLFGRLKRRVLSKK